MDQPKPWLDRDPHVAIAACLTAQHRANDPVQRGQWWTEGRKRLPELLRERDHALADAAALEEKLNAWDLKMPVPYVEETDQAKVRMDWWLRHHDDLLSCYARHQRVLDTLATLALLAPAEPGERGR